MGKMSKIMVIDDAYFVRLNVRTFLEEKGHEVAEAADGKEGLSTYKVFKPDLVFCDITMPVMDGLTFVKEVIGTHSDAKIVMLTSSSEPMILKEALAMGAKDFLVKPFAPDAALAVMKILLG
jgi:two-component system chemotaxis response regulator CheY